MTQRTETKTFQKEITINICDICNSEKGVDTCWLCKIDICNECSKTKAMYDPREYGDYPSLFCKSCWDKGEAARKEIEKLDEKEDQLETAWYKSCKNKEESIKYLRDLK